ncbi:amidase family protein [Streptomyces sp. NPDC086519]|uniref:amidase family protein n=1 Tax=Streptomyces sp. NPDC086519 TaxID=3154863 RepID=UPI003426232C
MAITARENHWALRNLLAHCPDGVSARGKGVLKIAEALGVDGYTDLLRHRAQIRDEHAELSRDLDVLVSLSSPGPAPLWAGDSPGEPLAPWPTGDPVFNAPGSLRGAPVVNVPLLTVSGMPVGVRVLGRPGGDARVTAGARWIADTVKTVSDVMP